jgi:D-alanyl-D-alanine carboxypeptidase (penicillin-binding protein 5/6)
MNDFQHFQKNITKIVKHAVKVHTILVPAIFAGLLFFAYTLYFSLQAVVYSQTLHPLPFTLPTPSAYPFLASHVTPDITAEAALVLDAQSQVVVYSKNPTLRFSPASTTKIMTALTAFSYFHANDLLTIQSSNIEPVVVGFLPGQKIRFVDVLYGMLVPSGNDAAIAIADNFPGGKDAFIAEMNRNAKLFHLYNTHYGDPVGLTDDETYTTVVDLGRLTSIALANPLFATIVSTKYATIYTADKASAFPLSSTNILLGSYGITGVKTGYTEGAKEVLVSSIERNGHTFIIIVMKSLDRFADTVTLIKDVVDKVTFVPMNQ